MTSETHPSQGLPPEDLRRDPIRVPLINGDTLLVDPTPDTGLSITFLPETVSLLMAWQHMPDRSYTSADLDSLLAEWTGLPVRDGAVNLALYELDLVQRPKVLPLDRKNRLYQGAARQGAGASHD